MTPEELHAQLERLNRSDGFSYRVMLAGLLAVHGRKAVVQALVESWSDNVVSIASSSSNWCRRPRPRKRQSKGRLDEGTHM